MGNLKPASAVAFSIPVGDQSSRKPPPKRLCNQAQGKRGGVSVESIKEKLKMAEIRRKVA